MTHRLVSCGDHPAGICHQLLSRFGERDVVQIARKELRAELFLQFLDALADGGLCPVHALGGSRKGSLLDDSQKMFEL